KGIPVPLGPAMTSDPRLVLEVSNGDNLSWLFSKAGLDAQHVQALLATGNQSNELTSLYPGNKLAFSITPEKILASLEIIKSPLVSHLYTRDEAGKYHFSVIEKEPLVRVVYKEAYISDSLFQAAQRGGIPAAMAMELSG